TSSKEKYDIVQNSKDVENMKKGLGYINSKGDKIVNQTVNRLKVERGEADRKAKKEAEAADREARKKAAEEAKAAKIEEETQAVREKFDALAAQGIFRQLDWKNATRQLNQTMAEFATAEGEIAGKEELRKVTAMQSVQEIFIKNLKGYTFKKSKLKGMQVKAINDRELVVVKGNAPTKLTWVKFYQQYHGNLNELIITFIEGGRETCKPKLSKLQWADAMCGAALTMRIICSDDPAAAGRGEQIAQKVVQEFADYEKTAKTMFPDIEFTAREDD
ncbi:MAG: hypothetical protein J6P80_05310, partial [Kiritimatiellae bacterium]|nr:hypothetical protein [Kiritimatiellia bacterium]